MGVDFGRADTRPGEQPLKRARQCTNAGEYWSFNEAPRRRDTKEGTRHDERETVWSSTSWGQRHR